MEVLFKELAGYAALGVEVTGVVVIAIGSLEAAFSTFRVMLLKGSREQKRAAWMRYAQWLVAGLTFQLAGDIIHSAIAPTWNEIGKLAAIAFIRTFLTFFLDHDMDAVRTLRETRAQGVADKADSGPA